MKKFSTGGFTAAGVLVLALAAGGVGGAMVAGGSSAPASPPAVADVDVVSDSATVEPSAAPSPSSVVVPAPEAAAEVEDQAPAPAVAQPVADDSANRAEEAAAKSEKAAKRSEDAADRAESTVPAKTAEPAPVPVAKKDCGGEPDGTVQGLPYRGEGGHGGEQVCDDGKWRVTKAPVDGPAKSPKSPEPSAPPADL